MSVRSRTLTLTVVSSLVLTLVACGSDDGSSSDGNEPKFGYALSRPIVTLNAASALGAATDAAKVSARLYPGAFLTGPDGRLLPNTDLVTATPTRDNGDVIDYRINEDATYSDGAPVVCDDFLLSWVAAEREDLFGSDIGLMSRIDDLSCEGGSKSFQVTMEQGMGSRYRELFSVGEVLPAHTIAERAGVEDASEAINAGNAEQLSSLGEAWRSTFAVAENDPANVPTYGPYRVASRGQDGSLSLGINPEWRGVQPGIDEIVLWSGAGAGIEAPDYRELAEADQLYVADVAPDTDFADAGFEPGTDASGSAAATEATETADGEASDDSDSDSDQDSSQGDDVRGEDSSEAPDLSDADSGAGRFAVSRGSGTRVDGLTLSDEGVFAEKETRQAFARCIDRARVASAVEENSGIPVDESPFRILAPGSPEAENLASVARRNNDRDPQAAAERLSGTTVRVGFYGDVSRYAGMVDAVAASCQEADVTVEPVALDADNYGNLGEDYDVLLDTRAAFGRNPQVSVPVSTGNASTRQLRDAENRLADEAATIPLTAEPRSVAVDRSLENVIDNPGETGMSWNMDRWSSEDFPQDRSETPTTTPEARAEREDEQ
ncbi:MAG TPA: hypothetical protein H9870_08860 [Candidatus Corynebacterium avicola]|uniref:Peptide ABC transporter n=1 Tax=Candidatus Corynebacterium avicola TaxID=2838527 RepID=A0A9D1UME3_9CORY|nr:hypothetical protein [Candidatus Corynebacterium avicola]